MHGVLANNNSHLEAWALVQVAAVVGRITAMTRCSEAQKHFYCSLLLLPADDLIPVTLLHRQVTTVRYVQEHPGVSGTCV